MPLSPGVDRTHSIPHNRLIRRQGEPLALDMIYDLKLIFLLYSVCFSPTAIGGALSRDQKLSDHINWI